MEIVKRTDKGKFAPGVSGNPNGRPKGAKDKRRRTTQKMREEWTEWVSKQLGVESLEKAKEEMSYREIIKLALDLAKLTMPKERDVKKKVSGEVTININRQKREIDNSGFNELEG